MARPAARPPGHSVTRVQCRRMARVDSIGLEVRRCTQCSAGKQRLLTHPVRRRRRATDHFRPPASFWHAAHTPLTSPDDLGHLTDAAGHKRRLQRAHRLRQRAAGAVRNRCLADLEVWQSNEGLIPARVAEYGTGHADGSARGVPGTELVDVDRRQRHAQRHAGASRGGQPLAYLARCSRPPAGPITAAGVERDTRVQ